MINQSKLEQFETLDGPIKMYYSKGQFQGAQQIQVFLKGMTKYYDQIFQVSPKLTLFIWIKRIIRPFF